MRQIIYTSRATAELVQHGFSALVGVAQRRNSRDSITGLLLFDGRRFLQALEGPAALADDCMGRIAADPRHGMIDLVASSEIDARQFGNFAMASIMTGAGDRQQFIDQVKSLTSDVPAIHLQALFIGFAVLA